MPELAEVAFYSKQWSIAVGQRVLAVELHPKSRVLRGCDLVLLESKLPKSRLDHGLTHGKQMLFHFSGGGWLGVHLGMTGKISAEAPSYVGERHDHLLLRMRRHTLVFHDPRQFGVIRFHSGRELPIWWQNLPPQPMDAAFTPALLSLVLQRHSRQPLKALLLDQRYFPGIGNWMADEVMWQLRLHPELPASRLLPKQVTALQRLLKKICNTALKTIGADWSDPPRTWLFHQRWEKGHHCPRCGSALVREEIRGRTACWCPVCQPSSQLPSGRKPSTPNVGRTHPEPTRREKR